MARINYRKIYEQHYGPIPCDGEGRTLEVHHIDGNHSNNSIENLKLVTIQEHYDIHYAQGDWGACFLMAERMKLSVEERSELSSKTQYARSAAGTHNWQGPEHNKKLVKQGIHPFLGSEVATKRNLKRINEGTHNWMKRPDGGSFTKDLVEAGKHHFVNDNPVLNTLNDGRHASKIRLGCVKCHKETTKNLFNRQHKDCFK